MAKLLADNPMLDSVVTYTEYQYHWAERICMDTILNAEDMGATVLNYVEAVEMNQEPDQNWSIRLQDTLDASTATVTGRLLVNKVGPWEIARTEGRERGCRDGEG